MARPADADRIAARIADAAVRGTELSPETATFLLRFYVASARADLGDALGLTLARALDAARDAAATIECAAWLTLFVEAASIAEDERILECVKELVARLRGSWPGDASTADALAASAASVDACLRAAGVLDQSILVRPAIDELERLVGAAYRPGRGLQLPPGPGVPPAHTACASALLTAFEITARLSYPMLAEELMQPVRRDAAGCAAARVLCRLAALHDNAEYRDAAVIAPDADYRADAARMLLGQEPLADAHRLSEAACYAIAMDEFLASSGPDAARYLQRS